jgi:hypothetical protein
VRRREFITLIGGAVAAWPLAARGQQARMRRVGVFMRLSESDPVTKGYLAAFVQGLRRSDGAKAAICNSYCASPAAMRSVPMQQRRTW